MSIVGINYEKCSDCNICLTACPLFRRDKEQNKVVFNRTGACNLCGQCIARCPEDAILYEGIGEALSYEGVNKPENIASYDTIYKFLRANRSTRLYKKKKVPNDVLKKVFDAMTQAPTSANRRTERFTILSDREEIKKLNDAVNDERLSHPDVKEKYGLLFKVLSKIFYNFIYFDAPHVIIVDSPLKGVEVNVGIIITYGRLAAQSLGLGTCWNGWTMGAIKNNPDIKKLIKIKGETVGVFTIGYSAVKFYRSPPRTPKQINGLE